MKRIISIVLIMLFVLPFSVFAKTGDVAGQYYSTDIHTFLNGYEIDSINIGGQTLISAEDMCYYGFHVFWNDAERQLSIYRQVRPINEEPPHVEKSDFIPGMVLGNYYETDIVTYLDGKTITACNVGGRTYIHAEGMRNWGYIVTWNETDRALDILSADRAGYEYSIPLSQGKPTEEEGTGGFSIVYTKDGLVGTEDADHFNATLGCTGTGYSIRTAFYQNDGLFKSTKLLEKLRGFVSSGISEEENVPPEEKYDLINQSVKLSINGYQAENIVVTYGRGNGHIDYYFSFDGIPLFREEEIEEIRFSVDENECAEQYDITFKVDEQ